MSGTEHSKAGEAVNPLGGRNSPAAPTRKYDRRHGAGVGVPTATCKSGRAPWESKLCECALGRQAGASDGWVGWEELAQARAPEGERSRLGCG